MSGVTVRTVEPGEFWEKEEDVLIDLLTMSAFTDERKYFTTVRKPNVGIVKKTVKKSIYDYDISSDEELSEAANGIKKGKEERKKKVPMGRGYGFQKYQLRQVGNCSPSALEETERAMRQPGEFWEKEEDVIIDLLTMSAVTDEKKNVMTVRKSNVGVVKNPVNNISSIEELSQAANGIKKEKEEHKKKVPMGRGCGSKVSTASCRQLFSHSFGRDTKCYP